MLFKITFLDGSVKTFQAHNRKQLEMALQHVTFTRPPPKSSQQKKK